MRRFHTVADHIHMTRQASAQLPFRTDCAVGKKMLIRTDGAGGTQSFLEHLTDWKLSYSLGLNLIDAMAEAVVPKICGYLRSIRMAAFATERGLRN